MYALDPYARRDLLISMLALPDTKFLAAECLRQEFALDRLPRLVAWRVQRLLGPHTTQFYAAPGK